MKYRIEYSFVNNRCIRREGTYYTNSLVDGYAFYDMVRRHCGWATFRDNT